MWNNLSNSHNYAVKCGLLLCCMMTLLIHVAGEVVKRYFENLGKSTLQYHYVFPLVSPAEG